MAKDAQKAGANERVEAAYDALGKHARLADLVAIARAVITHAAEARKADAKGPSARALAEEAKLSVGDAATPFGDPIATLERGPENDAERALACALWAHAIAESPPKEHEAEDRLASDILWLATHTPYDATQLLDRALGESAGEIWTAVADRVRRIDAHKLPDLGRGEALLGAAALSLSTSTVAAKHAKALATDLKDPALQRMFAGQAAPGAADEHMVGEVTAAPRTPLATAALALSGLLFLIHGVRLIARLALAYRRPAEVTLSGQGVKIHFRTIVLGRTLRERTVILGREGLVRAAREVRYPNAAFYAGLLALAVGSYVGISTFVEGARAASPSLLMIGFLITAAGIALDFGLASIAPSTQGLCRVLFVPRKGAAICIGAVDAARADTALARLSAP